MIRADTDSFVKLYFDNSEKLATTSTGIDVTGTVTFDGGTTSANLDFADNVKARFGTGNDLEMYWDGSDGYLTESGSGGIYIGSDSTVAITNAAVTENKAQFITNGAVKLFYDNAEKIATTSSGISITGGATATGEITSSNTVSQNSNGIRTVLGNDGGNGVIGTSTNHSLLVATNNTTRMTVNANGIDVTGDVLTDTMTLDNGSNDWQFSVSGNNLIISYGGTNKAKLDSSGNLTVVGNVTAFGTI